MAGVVGDLAWADMADTIAQGQASATSTVDWQGSLRGRIGLDGGASLPYLTAGLAFAHQTLEGTNGIVTYSDDQTHVGWTVGAGVGVAATENLSVDLLYRYSDYGAAGYSLGGNPAVDVGLTSHTLTVGLNFSF